MDYSKRKELLPALTDPDFHFSCISFTPA